MVVRQGHEAVATTMTQAAGVKSRAGQFADEAKPPSTRILAASMIGTAIEYYDFYIYATAASLVFGSAFFPADASGARQLDALSTFALAYLVRPLGAAVFGHFGDRYGRKATLVASLLTMGIATTGIGLLPTYSSIGPWAPSILVLLRIAQGVAFGGEWGGAVLLAIENASSDQHARFGAFPLIGTLVGGLLANLCFLVASIALPAGDFLTWGWRLPFLASAILVAFGLMVRLRLDETTEFSAASANGRLVRMPIATLLKRHARQIATGTFLASVIYVLVFICAIFVVGYCTKALGFSRPVMLSFECIALLVGIAALLISGRSADRYGCETVMLTGLAAALALAASMRPMLDHATGQRALGFLCLGYLTLGWIFAPMGAAISALFPVRVRYSGVAMAYNLAGVLGIAAAPLVVAKLVVPGNVGAVALYLATAVVLGIVAVPATRVDRNRRAGDHEEMAR